MKKILILIILVVVGFFILQNSKKDTEITSEIKGFDVGPNSAVFGEPVKGDLDADGDIDQALYVVEQPGGSGSFYYAVLAINNEGDYKLTEKMFLGDRIAPQNIEIKDGRAVYNFAERRADEPMTTPPSIGKSIWVHYNATTNEIGEWVKDFEGEADPGVMKLDMKKWEWISLVIGDDTKIVPKDSSKFVMEFKNDGTFSASTDCNGVGGEYTIKDNQITFSQMMSTLMYCEGSQEGEFRKILENTASYFFTSKGELKFELKFDSGVATFR